VPTESALAAARALRDDLWRQARADGRLSDALADAFEPAVRDADHLADRLRREASRVADLANLVAARGKLDADRSDLEARLARARRSQEERAAAWSALWAPAGVAAPGTPREMLAWLRRHAKLADDARAAREARDEAEALASEAAAHRRALAEALAPLGQPAPAGGETLADLAARGEEAVEALAEAASTRKRLEKELETAAHDRDDAARADAAAEAGWAGWRDRWAPLMARLGHPAETSPAAAQAVLESSRRLFERLDKARALAAALDAAAADAARFADDARALAARVTFDLELGADGFDPAAVASELHRRLTAARAAAAEHAAVSAVLRQNEHDAASARETADGFRDRLAALCREAGCDDPDELPAVEARAARRAELEAERDRLEADLRRLSAGTPLADFVAEVSAADPDALPVALARLAERIESLNRERREADEKVGGHRADLARMDGSAKAADAGEEAESLRARARSSVEQYARLRLASAVLRAGVERYRKKAQDPVLGRASDLFAALTLGSFSGLTVDYDSADEPVLVGVRPGAGDGGVFVGVAAMSEGTADQLYLALRLAALETFLDRHEPLPLVVDDILIQFDDARTRATLAVLADLSRRTQVLVFTHHEHLLALAESCVPPGSLFAHRLPSRRAAPAGANGAIPGLLEA
jgi:uncharacterized protein YhaN